MKVVLIAPPYPITEGPSAPLGLCYVAAAFERAQAEVIILDYLVSLYSPEKLEKELKAARPDLIGTTSVTLNFNQAAAILKTARDVYPSAVTVMGGPHVSFDYEATLRNYPEIDLIVIGEGEETISELAPAIGDRDAWRRIRGIAFLDDGELIVTPPRKHIQDLDSLPLPARHLLPLSKYMALGFPVSIITSRGCPHRCIFCQGHRMVGNKVRSRNPVLVVDEIESLLRHGFQRVNFSDDFFTSNIGRVRAICDEINRRGLVFQWTAFARADSVSPELLQIMRRTGCDTIFFGMESGNQEMLDRVRKRVKLDRIRQAVADSKAAGMRVFGSFIVGLPGETRETLMDSHRFAEGLDIMYGYHFLAPFPGTTVYDQMDQYDLELLSHNWSDYDANSAIVQTSSVTAADIESFVEEYYMKTVRAVEARIEAEMQAGSASEEDRMVYLGNKRLNVIYKLLCEDAIEKLSPISASLNGTKPEAQIAAQIASQIDQPLSYVLPCVQNLLERQLLQLKTVDSQLTCSWA